ncbi:MAG: phage portal protein, partial [Alphaproteobacteria bacterium]|nr:phage portal protein [Alphaproteobacteria bacterium]
YSALSTQGLMHNAVVFRCVRMIAENCARVPFAVTADEGKLTDHPVLGLLKNPGHGATSLIDCIASYLQISGNAYLEAAIVDDEVRGLYCLRPDRMRVVPGANGWPRAYEYTVRGRTRTIPVAEEGFSKLLHIALFHPLDDHYGLAPLEVAHTSLDIHNAASRWNKSLLDNAARPSGALIYSAASGNMSEEQFARLKTELEQGYQGAANAGRPMVLEGGLDWKALGLSPKDMDFIEAKNVAAREIALAFGVPPMMLGIPGDNTYANYAEANRALWRLTIVPLVNRIAEALSIWLGPAFEGNWTLVPQFETIEALSADRAALWERVGSANFLNDDEKRELLGIVPRARAGS